MPATVEPFFHRLDPGPTGRRFCLWHSPGGPPRSVFVFVHAFAEEMNKSRRMAALQARALADAGHAVLQIDLLGCGDSDGDFGDATWQAWVADVEAAVGLARAKVGAEQLPLWLWGHRVGALLASAAAERLTGPVRLLLWQPTVAGKAALQQFLRLEAIAARIGKVEAVPATPARQRLAAGEVVTVAGYAVAPALAHGLEAAAIAPAGAIDRVVWLDVVTEPTGTLTPAAIASIGRLRDAGIKVVHETVTGPAFWQTVEIEEAPALLAATLRHADPQGQLAEVAP